jgi:hypothetical protein
MIRSFLVKDISCSLAEFAVQQGVTLMSKTNVVQFPGPTGGNRNGLPHTHCAMSHDFMVMANYLTTCADETPWPKWTACVASELRRLARDIGKS